MALIKTNSSAVARAINATLVIVVVILGLAGFAILESSGRIMRTELQAVNDGDLRVLQALYDQVGFGELIETVRLTTQAPVETRNLIEGIYATDGVYLAGDAIDLAGLQNADYVAVPHADGNRVNYLTTTLTFPEGTVFIGRRVQIIESTLRNLLVVLPLTGAALLATLIVSFRFSAFVLGRQLDRFETTLMAFSRGNTLSRVPLGPDTDDRFFDVSHSINANLALITDNETNLANTTVAIAHDLRTPLTRASLAIQVARGEAGLSQEAADRLDDAEAELRKLNVTFDTILRISNIHTSLSEATFCGFDLNELVADVVENYAPMFEDAGFILTASPAAGTPAMLWADRSMIVQLIINLLTNILRHCPAGTTARIEVVTHSNAITLTVSDNGPGVPPEALTEIFVPFSRVDPSRTRDGTGLGLALVQAIVSHHGATIQATSAKPGLAVCIHFARDDRAGDTGTKA